MHEIEARNGTRLPVLIVFALLSMLVWVSVAAAGGYSTPTVGQSPHGSYVDAASECKVCHAVHNSDTTDEKLGGGTETLLRSKKGYYTGGAFGNPVTGNACVYCHIVGDWAILKVYNSTLASYTANSRYNHEDYHAPPGWGPAYYQGCNSCHSVHAAKILGAPYTAKILRNDPGEGMDVPATNLTEFCRDCHDEAYDPFGATKWYGFTCSLCHNEGFMDRGGTDDGSGGTVDNIPPMFSAARDGVTHIMTTTLTGPTGMQVAWNDSDECRDCHKGGNNTPANDFPHFTSGAYFLDDAYTPTDGAPGTVLEQGMDRVCLNCHVEGGNGAAYTTGVGKTF